MSRLSALLESFQKRDGVFLFDGRKQCSYRELHVSVQTWREWYRSRSWSEVVGLRADFGRESIALLLALMAEHQTVALLPRDSQARDYVKAAGCGKAIDLARDGSVNVASAEAAPAHPVVAHLRSQGESGLVIFTSGTSGVPKAALHTLERLLSKYGVSDRPLRCVAFLMFDHIAGIDTLFHALTSGGALIAVSRRDPRSVARAMSESKAEVLPASPSFLRLFLASGATGAEYPDLKIITYGSEAMDPTTLHLLNERFPSVRLIQKYGTTETGSPRTESRDPGSLWFRFRSERGTANTEHRVEKGVLWLRTSGTLLCYLNAPAPLTGDGWYCTGDLIESDGEWIRITGRATESLNVGGEKVAPLEVEATILELPYVATAAVYGEPNALLGQIVVARVALAPVAPPSAEVPTLIRRHCRSRLAGYKVPVKIEIATGSGVTDRQKTERGVLDPERV